MSAISRVEAQFSFVTPTVNVILNSVLFVLYFILLEDSLFLHLELEVGEHLFRSHDLLIQNVLDRVGLESFDEDLRPKDCVQRMVFQSLLEVISFEDQESDELPLSVLSEKFGLLRETEKGVSSR